MIDIHRNIAPPLQLIDAVNFQKPLEINLDKGIKAFFIKGGSHEILKFELLFKSGSYHQDKPLQAIAMANLLKMGTTRKTSEEINKLWDFFGVSLQIEAQKDIISIGFFCLTRHLDPVLDLLVEIISDASFPADELDSMLKKKRQKYIINQQNIEHLARIHFNELLFGGHHPYGAQAMPEDFDTLTRDDLQRYHARFIHPNNCICFVSGNFPDDIAEIINMKLQRVEWKGNADTLAGNEYIPDAKTGNHFICKDDAVQSSIRIGKLMIGRSHPDYHKVSITNTLLGGFFGSRLMQNIRQDKGYTYGIHSALVSLLRETYFFISTQVGNDVKQLAHVEIYNELNNLRKNPAGSHELSMLKNYLSAGFLRSFDGPFMQMERFRENFLFGMKYSHYEDFLPLLHEIKAEDIQEMGEKYFHEDNMLELVVGNQIN
jgi:zinc protease